MKTLKLLFNNYFIFQELSFGADSNGSGVAALLELARIFSVLYSNPKTHAPFNILFFISGGGKFNYLGSKKWLEDQIDGLETSLIQDSTFVLCLDSLSSNSTIHFHVSKPPKENSSRGLFYQQLVDVAGVENIQMIHKKINLADDFLAWEHERYGIRRLPALTLSALKVGLSTKFDIFLIFKRYFYNSITYLQYCSSFLKLYSFFRVIER